MKAFEFFSSELGNGIVNIRQLKNILQEMNWYFSEASPIVWSVSLFVLQSRLIIRISSRQERQQKNVRQSTRCYTFASVTFLTSSQWKFHSVKMSLLVVFHFILFFSTSLPHIVLDGGGGFSPPRRFRRKKSERKTATIKPSSLRTIVSTDGCLYKSTRYDLPT